MSVEVERKFACDSNIRNKLEEVGAVSLGQCEFKDQYFDSADFTLTLKDFWLRKREGSWELKRPTCSRVNAESRVESGCSKYREITDVPRIRAELTALVGMGSGRAPVSPDDAQAAFERWLQERKLESFAEFRTVRRSYALEYPDRSVRVDLDQADFGYCVGEIEVLVSEGAETASAMQSIKKTAEELGVAGEAGTQGKMEVYLRTFRPDHYAALLKARVL